MYNTPLDRPLLNGIPHSWTGTAEDLAAEIARLASVLRLDIKMPSVRTVRLWRTKKLLGKDKRGRFGCRQLLEAFAVAVLLEKGWNSTAIAGLLAGSDDAALARIIKAPRSESGSAPGSLPTSAVSGARRYAREAAEDAAILLAQGILSQFERVLAGRGIVRQDDAVPRELHRAMMRIGRLRIEEGLEDRAACVHDVLARACHPLGGEA